MSNDESEMIIISPEESGIRLDKILAARYQNVQSRTYFQHLIKQEAVLLNGLPVKKRMQPKEGDEVEVCFLATPELELAAEPIPLDIVFEDDYLLVVNKPAGMVVHPAPGNWSGTFVNALLYHCKSLQPADDSLRPGIVHRLDKDTSGLLLAAKTPLVQQRLIRMFADREIEKHYVAICVGNPGKATIDQPVGRHPVHRKKMAVHEKGRRAITSFQTQAFDGKLSLVNIRIETGRTHQIRVHMLFHGTPVLGDSTYGNAQANTRYKADRQMLHAQKLRFNHPITGEQLEFIAPLPADMMGKVRG